MRHCKYAIVSSDANTDFGVINIGLEWMHVSADREQSERGAASAAIAHQTVGFEIIRRRKTTPNRPPLGSEETVDEGTILLKAAGPGPIVML